MSPVILLSDGYLANGSGLWNIPLMDDLRDINPPKIKDNNTDYKPYKRNPNNLVRYWAIPGQKGLRHIIGGLEKSDITGELSYDPYNHEIMSHYRRDKISLVAKCIPHQLVNGNNVGDLLVVGWGGTYGTLFTAVNELQEEGFKISLAQFNYINPLPENTGAILSAFKQIIVCELNLGQFITYLRSQFPEYNYLQYNKVQGYPFLISELKDKFRKVLKNQNKKP